MSTYNGGVFLEQQLNSLINQKYNGKIDIHIRDDGSTDNTSSVLEKYKKEFPDKIFYTLGTNVGPAKSFLSLLNEVSDYDYYAFCDQDDNWLPEKVQRACHFLMSKSEKSAPLLYCSALRVVDRDLNLIRVATTNPKMDLKNAMVESSIAGCTMVFNDLLRSAVVKTLPMVNKYRILMHDAWVLKVALLNGDAFYDTNSYIEYRQHENNVIGTHTTLLSMIRRRIKNIAYSYKEHSIVDEAVLLNIIYSNTNLISNEKLALINEVINLGGDFSTRTKQLVTTKVYRNRKVDKVIFHIMVVLGLYKMHIETQVNA